VHNISNLFYFGTPLSQQNKFEILRIWFVLL